MLPQIGGADAAEDNVHGRVDLAGDFGDIDSAPAVGVQNRKPDDIRPFFLQRLPNLLRSEVDVVPVQNLDVVAVLPAKRRHEKNPLRQDTDLLDVSTLFEKVGINEQNLHAVSAFVKLWPDDPPRFDI